MIYIYEENVEFYDSLGNKSEFINEALRLKRKTTPVDAPTDDPNWHPDPRIRETRERIAAMDESQRKQREARKQEAADQEA
jgi:hypothetical protein